MGCIVHAPTSDPKKRLLRVDLLPACHIQWAHVYAARQSMSTGIQFHSVPERFVDSGEDPQEQRRSCLSEMHGERTR